MSNEDQKHPFSSSSCWSWYPYHWSFKIPTTTPWWSQSRRIAQVRLGHACQESTFYRNVNHEIPKSSLHDVESEVHAPRRQTKTPQVTPKRNPIKSKINSLVGIWKLINKMRRYKIKIHLSKWPKLGFLVPVLIIFHLHTHHTVLFILKTNITTLNQTYLISVDRCNVRKY